MSVLRLFLITFLGAQLMAQDKVQVFAAASLSKTLTEIVAHYSTATIDTTFAATATLAKQIEAGAPADLFISADRAWMDYLAAAQQIDTATRIDLLGNALAIIAPKDRVFPVTVAKNFDFAHAFTGRLAVGDPAGVPVGRYTQEAFTNLGWWAAFQDRLTPTGDVRATLRLVESGETDAGVVYVTDAMASSQVTIVATVPTNLHKPVVYPMALTTRAGAPAQAFAAYLRSEAAKAVFVRHGFTWLVGP